MSIAGKTMLLAILLLGVSGAQSQSFAREKSPTITITGKATKSTVCSPLQSLLLVKDSPCVYKKLPQVDFSTKAQSNQEEDKQILISYAVEPTYYVPPVETSRPTITPTITSNTSVTPVQQPLDMVAADGASLNSDMILELINSHRATIGKAPFQKEGALCSLAATRSVELHGELFGNAGYLHSGLYSRNLPYWITENAKWGSNESGTVKWWLNSPIHRRAIEGDYTYSCGACDGSKCAQLFTSYSPKTVATASSQ